MEVGEDALRVGVCSSRRRSSRTVATADEVVEVADVVELDEDGSSCCGKG